MDLTWFEMRDLIRKDFGQSSWIPLYASLNFEQGKYGFDGYKEEYFGAYAIMTKRGNN